MSTTETGSSIAVHGLSLEEVAARVSDGLVNDVLPAPTRTVGQIVRANVVTKFNAILGTMLFLALIAGDLRDALFGIVLVANAAIGIVQELRAKRTLDRLTLLTAPRARVVRDGIASDLAVDRIVLDDVLELKAGFQVVVDAEVLIGEGLEVDESLLTGESDPVRKRPGDEVLSGSFVAAGAGRVQAVRVGREAYAASITADARRFTLTHSELQSGINRILTYCVWGIVPLATLLFASQYRANDSWQEALRRAVAGTVAMIPEGLVLLTSLAFAVAVMRLAQERVLVKELPAVEGLARVDVLCVDKTGTLTEGNITLERVEPLEGVARADVDVALAAFAAHDPAPNATMLAIRDAFPEGPSGWLPEGGVPFSSARRWSAMDFAGRGVLVLGAPDVMLDRSEEAVLAAASDAADRGERVVLLARTASLHGDDLPPELSPIALVILGDRPRPDAAATLAYFAEQGVTVKVISGDDPRTVGAIADRVGLPRAHEPVDARSLPAEISELADILESHAVFGRVTPRQKRAMVAALQSRGHTVAMTGDGVNDALALKDADIGVAMGSGSQATRSVAQLVLLDSTFDALPAVVAEGRRVLGNIERTSGLYLTKTVYAMLISLATGLLSFVFPFLPRHLTLVGALTIGIPSFFLALAPNTQRFRPGFVERVLGFAVPAGTLAAIATLLAYVLAQQVPGVTLAEAQTTSVMTLTWIGLLVLSILAAPLTRPRLALIWSMAAIFLVVIISPWGREFFALDPPVPVVWLAAIGVAAIVWSFARLFVPGERPEGPAPG